MFCRTKLVKLRGFMKTHSRISFPVMFCGATAIVLMLALIWFRSARHAAVPGAESPPPVAAVASPASSVSTAPLPVATAPWSGELPPVVPISLAGLLTPAENDQWDKSGVFKVMPRGQTNLGHIEFWLEGLIQLQSKASQDENRTYRERIIVPLALTNTTAAGIEIVQRGSNVASVHLLGATRYGGEGEVGLADLVWRYADNSAKRTTIRFENHVRDWIRLPYETPSYLPYPFSKVVWHNAVPGQAGRMVRLYRFSFANPEPAKTIRQLELVSAMQTPNLFLVGLTLDPLRLGERPDDSPNLEPPDPVPPAQMELAVQSTDGVAVPNAKVRVLIQQTAGRNPARFERTHTTDFRGLARVSFPPVQDLERLDIGASHDDHGGRKIVWDTKAGDTIPASYTLKLVPGVNLGGVVVDENDTSIAGATLSFYRFWTGPNPFNLRGEQSDFTTRTVTSDAQGVWQIKGLPGDLLGNVDFRAKAPDCVETRTRVGEDASTLQQLRAGTFRVVLRRGLTVAGKVTDENGNSVAGATITAGRQNFAGTREVKSDAQGAFVISGLNAGEIQFSALAKGRKPEVRNIEVKSGMPEILFKLGPGRVIRGIVQDENSQPISSVRLSLESRTGGVSDTYPFEMTTGSDGRFEWDGAPDETVNFAVLKSGYEVRRRQTLKPNEENVVTLRHCRKIEGWVLDATTEQPVTKFRVGLGRGGGSFFANYPGMKDYAEPNGRFTLEANEEDIAAVKAEADDYAERIEKLPEAQNGVVQVVLRLKPSAALRGVLLSPEGAPVAGGTVAFTSGQPGVVGVSLRNGRLDNRGSQGKIVTTDASGQFTLTSPPESGLVAGAAEMGFAIAPIQQVRDSGRLVLQTFGRIEGTFKVGGQPVAGQEFTFSMMNLGVMFDFGSYKATTDEQGHFSMEKIPPGEGQIVRLVKMSPNSWRHSHSTDVVVEPGKTTQVTLGDSGAVLKGHVSFETPPADGEKLTLSGDLNTPMPQRPPSFHSAEEARAFFESPEWKAQMKQIKRFGVAVNTDGSLMLDSIPPGDYTLSIVATKPGNQPWEATPVARGEMTITVPENANPFSPITLGELVLKPMPQPNPVQR